MKLQIQVEHRGDLFIAECSYSGTPLEKVGDTPAEALTSLAAFIQEQDEVRDELLRQDAEYKQEIESCSYDFQTGRLA